MIRAIFLLLLFGTPAAAQATLPPAAMSGDPRLQTLPYDVGRVVRLRIPLGFQTTLVLDPNERVENVALGDSDSWQVEPNGRGDHVFIKPVRAGAVTNLTVVTDIRVYVFELSTSFGAAADTPFIVRFLYPEVRPPASELPAPMPISGHYRLTGSRPLRPGAVSDDGRSTFVEWRPDQTLPAVFALDERRREILLDGHMRDGRYVIDGVYQTLLFKLDRQVARAARTISRSGR